jgi:hypothetical protein
LPAATTALDPTVSVFLASDLDELSDLLESNECYRCGGRLTGQPVVVWVGHPGQTIAMHPDCARSIAVT